MADANQAAWTPEGDTMWRDFLADVFGEPATDVGTMPYDPPAEKSKPMFSFGMDTGGEEQSSSEEFSGTGSSAPALARQQSTVQPTEFESSQISAPAMSLNTPLSQPNRAALSSSMALSPRTSALPSSVVGTQQTQPNVFQSTSEYTKNLSPPQEEEPNNAHVQVMPDGTILLRIGGQWIPLGQPQQQAVAQG